jgi:hypothetical protein
MAKKRKGATAKVVKATRVTIPMPADTLSRLGAYAHWRGERVGAVVTRAVEAMMSADRFVIYCGSPPSPAPAEGPAIGQDEPGEGETLRAG